MLHILTLLLSGSSCPSQFFYPHHFPPTKYFHNNNEWDTYIHSMLLEILYCAAFHPYNLYTIRCLHNNAWKLTCCNTFKWGKLEKNIKSFLKIFWFYIVKTNFSHLSRNWTVRCALNCFRLSLSLALSKIHSFWVDSQPPSQQLTEVTLQHEFQQQEYHISRNQSYNVIQALSDSKIEKMASTRFYAHISLSIRLVVLVGKFELVGLIFLFFEDKLCGFHDIDPDSSVC